MRVDPITLNTCSSCDFSWIQSSTNNKVNDLFNKINNISINKTDVFQHTSKQVYIEQDEVITDYGYVNAYFQYGNEQIHNLAMEIVNSGDSDDIKMEKIQRWVYENIRYMTDQEQYGYEEIWVPPTMTLQTMAGDCEDNAYLVISLALNAGVDPNRLRFYAGIVKAGEGAETGGHGWVAYKRESDDEWVAIDTTYYPDLRPMDMRIKLKDDDRYIDDYFIFELGKVIITPDNNRVKNTTIYNNIGNIKPNILLPETWINAYA